MTDSRARREARRTSMAVAAALMSGLVQIGATDAFSEVSAQDSLSVAVDTVQRIPSRAVVHVDSSALLVGGAIRVLGGSTDDPAGQEGGAAVLAVALNRVLASSLAGTSGSADVSVDREALSVRFLASPDEWRTTTEIVLRSVFSPVAVPVLESARADHLARLKFEAGAPVRDFQERRFPALFGTTSKWSRPVHGTAETVERIDLDALGGRLVGASERPSSFAALAGAVSVEEAARLLEAFDSPGPPEDPSTIVLTREWDDGFQEWIPVEITSVWVSLAFPAYSNASRPHLAMLAHHVREYLTTEPVRPGIIAPRVELLEAPRGPVLMITFAVTPESAEQWANRMIEVVRLERAATPDEGFFNWQRRRFRTARRADRTPVDHRAAILAREHSVGRPAGRPVDESVHGPTTPEPGLSDLREIAGALGPARVILYGPSMSEGPAEGGRGNLLILPEAEGTFRGVS